MTPLRDILAAASREDDGLTATIPADWRQGRTTYGGLSSALALHAAQQSAPDLPPLRSAQISFIGPVADEVRITARLLRRGRNAAFVQADILSADALAFRATFVFMADRESTVSLDAPAGHDLAPPAADARLYTGPDDFFTGNFNFLDVKAPDLGPAELLRWARLRDADGLDPMVHLMAVADSLPPAAFKLLGNVMVPVSSVTWTVNLLTAMPATRDGWWLLSSRSDQAANGGSSQSMAIWNADGDRIAEGMQSVLIFA